MGPSERGRLGDSKTVNAPNAPPQSTLPEPFEVRGKLEKSQAKWPHVDDHGQSGVIAITDRGGDGLSQRQTILGRCEDQ